MSELPNDYLEQLKKEMPRRDGHHGWGVVPRLVAKAMSEGHEWPRIIAGVIAYRQHCRRRGTEGTEYVMQAKTFLGRDCHWDEWADMDTRTPAQIAQETRWTQLEDRARALGFTTVDRVRGYEVALRAVEQEERKRAGEVMEKAGLQLKVVGK